MYKRAFLVGINYLGTENQLGGCINDVFDMKEILVKYYNYDEKNILIMTDLTEYKPTKENIIKGFRWLLSKNTEDQFEKSYDIFSPEEKVIYFFQFSGHGSQVYDKNNDEKDHMDETIYTLDGKMIEDDEMRINLVNNINENCKLYSVIDACHSGTDFDLCNTTFIKHGMIKKYCHTDYYDYKETQGNVILISGCKDNQTSADVTVDHKKQGALTYSLIEVLKENNYDINYHDLMLKMDELIRVKKLSSQSPCISFGKKCQLEEKFEF